MVSLWLNFLGREACEMYDAPEAIASSSKMVPRRGRCQSGVDSAEQHLEMSRNDVG